MTTRHNFRLHHDYLFQLPNRPTMWSFGFAVRRSWYKRKNTMNKTEVVRLRKNTPHRFTTNDFVQKCDMPKVPQSITISSHWNCIKLQLSRYRYIYVYTNYHMHSYAMYFDVAQVFMSGRGQSYAILQDLRRAPRRSLVGILWVFTVVLIYIKNEMRQAWTLKPWTCWLTVKSINDE